MAKRKSKNEIEITSNETTIENKEVIENKENKETNDKNKENYVVTKKTEGVYLRKLRRL